MTCRAWTVDYPVFHIRRSSTTDTVLGNSSCNKALALTLVTELEHSQTFHERWNSNGHTPKARICVLHDHKFAFQKDALSAFFRSFQMGLELPNSCSFALSGTHTTGRTRHTCSASSAQHKPVLGPIQGRLIFKGPEGPHYNPCSFCPRHPTARTPISGFPARSPDTQVLGS